MWGKSVDFVRCPFALTETKNAGVLRQLVAPADRPNYRQVEHGCF